MGARIQKNIGFLCKDIWPLKKNFVDYSNISLLQTTCRDNALVWYMKFKATTSLGRGMILTEIR